MKKPVNVLSMLIVSATLLAACGGAAATPTSAPTSAPAATAAPAATMPPNATMPPDAAMIPDSAKVMVADSSLGKILVDEKGMVLYMYTKDSSDGTSVCYDKCAIAWPPLLTKNKATASDGAQDSLLGTTTRKDGTMQVTYKNMPLYYYQKDQKPGDTTGQDVGKVWYVVAPNGDVIGK
jgi:predicted lipoprotein with Yx(FWY)xxD motif